VYLLGLDVGTTGCKAVIFDKEGNIAGYGFREYDIICERPGYAEQDALKVWKLTKEVIKEAVEKSGASSIQALSLSVQGDAIIPVDENIHPLHQTLLGMDYRSTAEVEYCKEVLGDKALFEATGMRPHPMNSATKILWIKNNLPDIYKKTYKFMTYADFILSKLGARPVIDLTMASRTMLFDIHNMKWSTSILSTLDIDEQKLSEPVKSGEVVGELSKELAEELGIEIGTVLVAGGHDQACAALGAGVINENIAIDSHGTAEVLATAFNLPKLGDTMYEGYYPCYCHAKEGMYLTFALNHIGGLLLKWYRDNLGYAEVEEAKIRGEETYDVMLEKISNEPSSVLVLPHFNGSGTPWCDLDSKGAMVGLTMATTRHDIVKGIMESLTYELRINIEHMQKSDIYVERLRAVGGAAKSPIWLQIKADITGCVVETLKIREGACLGAALLAGVATKVYKDLDEAVETTVKVMHAYTPRKQMKELYDAKYASYTKLYDALKSISKAL
jgi:xylulokinase